MPTNEVPGKLNLILTAMRGYLVVLLVCLASIQLIDAGRRSGSSSRSSSSSSRSSSGWSSRSSSSSSRSSGSRRSSYGGGYQSGGTRSSGSRSTYSQNTGSTGSRANYNQNQNRGSSSSRSRSVSTNSKYSPNHGYGSNYVGYGSKSHKTGTGYSYKSKGYGTRWGTDYSKAGRNTHYSKKALGLGVGAGFVGGAIVGGAATYAVYHRYNAYRDLMYRHRYGYGIGGGPFHDDFGWGSAGYYNDYYMRDQCRWACRHPAICRYGFCECPYGYTKRWGRCSMDWSTESYRPRRDFDPLSAACTRNEMCFDYDFNLICNTNVSTTAGRCQCRTDMRWNAEEYECQLYLDVDCSSITYDSKVDPIILEAVNKTEKRIENDESINLLVAGNEIDPSVANETAPSREETLKTSLLESIDPKKANEDQIREAYCRDVDALSHEFQKGGAFDDDNDGMDGGAIAGIVIFIVIFIIFCAVCCTKSKKKSSRAPPPVALSDVQDHEKMQSKSMSSANQPGHPATTQANQPGYPAATQAPQPGYPAATQAFESPNQPGYTPIYPPVNQ